MVTKCFPSLCVGVKSCWSQTAQRLFWRAQPPETWTTTKQTPQESKDKPMDAEHPKSFYTNNKDFLPLNTSFVLKQKKKREAQRYQKKKFVSVSKHLSIISTSAYLHLHAWFSPVTGFTGFVRQSVFLAHAMSSDRGLWPVRCSISHSIRLQKPSWSSG